MKKGIIIGLLFLLLVIYGCDNQVDRTIRLKSVEVKEYQGQKLGSFTDFRENSIKGVQYINISEYTLEVSGLVESAKEYNYEEILSFQKYSKVVTLYCVEGWDVKALWTGILLKDMFDDVKVRPDANTVIFYAYDGYSTSLPLDYIIDNDIIMAYKLNNITLPSQNGFPFQLVAENKWGYKWVKWITKIELSNNTDFKGYWESRGYSNEGDGPRFD